MTALHEAGHALTCLLVGCKIHYWTIIEHEYSLRMNRRIRRRSTVVDGEGCIAHEPSPHELHIALSGEASESIEKFLDDDVRTFDGICELYGEGSDQCEAWHMACAIHTERLLDTRDEDICRKIMAMYGQIYALFQQPPFVHASIALSTYMLERDTELDDVNTRMRQFLDRQGIGKSDLSAMKTELMRIRLPLFE